MSPEEEHVNSIGVSLLGYHGLAMASKFSLQGGKPLRGGVEIQGSKNTALALIAAALLTEEPVEIENVPTIKDVAVMAAIAEKLGVEVAWERPGHRITLCARDLRSDAPDKALSRRLRASILFSGALLGRLRGVTMPYPGGDAIGARPLNTHFHALEALGVSIEEDERIRLDGQHLRGEDLTLEETSVTATENTILAAVLAPGRTIIRLAAYEPHVQELVTMLQAMGAEIRWAEHLRVEINGVERLRGAAVRVNPDELEISGFATLAAATGSEISLTGIEPKYLDAVFLHLRKMRVPYQREGTVLMMRPATRSLRAFRIQSGLYPKLGSDHLPPFAVLATQAEGTSLIHDWIYEKRLSYIPELQKMGAECRILDPHRALITGPTPLHGTDIESLDIRSGLTLVIAALAADGTTTIRGVEHLDRGYERLEERLQALGADIQRMNS